MVGGCLTGRRSSPSAPACNGIRLCALLLMPIFATALGTSLAAAIATYGFKAVAVKLGGALMMKLFPPLILGAAIGYALGKAIEWGLEKWGPGGAKDMKKAAEKSGKALAEGLDKGYRDELKQRQQPMIDAFTGLSKTLRGVATVGGLSAETKAAAKKQLLAAHSELERIGKQRAALLRAEKDADKRLHKYRFAKHAAGYRKAARDKKIWAEQLKELKGQATQKRDAMQLQNKKWLRDLQSAGISEEKLLEKLAETSPRLIAQQQKKWKLMSEDPFVDVPGMELYVEQLGELDDAVSKTAKSLRAQKTEAVSFMKGTGMYGILDTWGVKTEELIDKIQGSNVKLDKVKKESDRILKEVMAGKHGDPTGAGFAIPDMSGFFSKEDRERMAKQEMAKMTKKFGKEIAKKLAKKKLLAKEAEEFLKDVNVGKLLEANQIIVAAQRINRNKKFIKRAQKTAINMGKDVDKLAGAMVKMSVKLDHAVSRGSKDAVKKVGKVVASLREMQSMLAGVGTVPIDVLIDNFAKASLPGGGKVGDEARSAAGGKVKINVNVYMEARQLVSEMTYGNPVDAERIRPDATCGMDDVIP